MKLIIIINNQAPQYGEHQLILIEDYDDLIEHFEKVRQVKMAGAIETYLHEAIIDSLELVDQHRQNSLSQLLRMMHQKSGTDLISTAHSLQMELCESMMKALDTFGKIMVNKAGGFSNIGKHIEIKEIKVVEFPPKEFLLTAV